MLRSRALDRLHEHQGEILALMRTAEPMLTDPLARDVPGLARARWALMRALTAYQMFKHREIFDPLIAKAAPGEAHRLLRMKRACLDLGDVFRAYVQRWSACDVEGRWAEYQPAALAMMARLRTHIAREREEVTALLSKAA